MKFKKFMVWFLSILILFFLFLHFYLPRTITEINNPLLKITRDVYQSLQPKQPVLGKQVANYGGFSPTKFTWKSNDGLTLHGQYKQVAQAKATVLLLHGIQSSKERYNSLMPFLASQDYSSVAVDLRAHGESDGQFCTFGVQEKQDISALIDLLEQENFQQPYGIWGHSLGGAVALQTLAIDSRLKFGVVESTFSNFKTIVDDYFQFYTKTSFPKLTNYLAKRAGQLSNFNYLDVSPLTACKQITQPMLIVHGTNDQKISIKYGKANFEALASSNKQFLPIQNGSHDSIWEDAGNEYFTTVKSFLDSAIE